MLKRSLNICAMSPVLPQILLVTYLLTELYWPKFKFLFITLYLSPVSCSFMHLTTLVSISVSLSYGLINIPAKMCAMTLFYICILAVFWRFTCCDAVGHAEERRWSISSCILPGADWH